MPFDYESATTAVVNALNGYNTTTSTPDLSAGMTRRVRAVYRTDPEIFNPRGDVFPVVLVRIVSKDEEFGGLGRTGGAGRAAKYATVNYDVVGLYRKDGAHTSHSTLTFEVQRLAENIEGVFQRELTLSGSALWCSPTRTDFMSPYGENETWIKGIKVSLEARYMFQ